MSSLSEAEKRFSLPTYETFAFWLYVLGVAMTALGPIAHYIGWTFALISLVYGRIRYNTPLLIKLQPEGRKIICFLVLFLFWSMFAHIPYVDSFYTWGKGASIPLEFLTGLYLAVRLIDTSKKREIFGLVVVTVNLVFCFDVMFRPDFQILGWNGSLDNGNAVALYSLILMPFFCCYALWYYENKIIFKYFLCFTSVMLVFFSFSSGGWLTAGFQAVILVCYAIKEKKINLKSLFIFLSIVVISLSVLIYSLGNGFQESVYREINQITAFDNPQLMTTDRIDTWKAGFFLAMKHPVIGGGWANFESEFNRYHKYMIDNINYKRQGALSQPHSMFISILYAGGFPSLLSFICALTLSIRKSWIGNRDSYGNGVVPWFLICLVLLSSQIIYGTNGDIFEARRDISVIFWACWGLLIVMPESDQNSNKGDKSENPALC
ncbi:MAG: O-antigen ligase family protein [Synergistaceae bacterium]|nr:O-antigen ligase family protein [Synergistaceae bacterium]